MLETIQSCALAQLGKSAAQSTAQFDGDSALLQFNQIASDFSSNKLGIDYLKLEQLGTELAARLPDLKLYSYLFLAVFHNETSEAQRYIRVGALLLSLSDLLASPSSLQKLSPKSDARRQGQLQWLSTELALFFQMSPPRPSEAAAFLALKQIAEQVAETAGAAFGLSHPLLRELRETINKQASTLPPPEVEKPAPPVVADTAKVEPATSSDLPPVVRETPSPAPSVDAAPRPQPLDVATLEIDEVESQLAELVIRLANHLRTEAIDNPAPYWMLRGLRFGCHDLLRPERIAQAEGNNGKTELPAPQGHARKKKELTDRLAAGQAADVVHECEELFAQSPLWLDLQRIVAEGLSVLRADRALSAVQSQVEQLIKLCPSLPALRFADRDGTALADSETQAWLKQVCSGNRAAPTPNHATKDLTETTEARLPSELLPAVRLLQQRIVQSVTGSQRFALRLQLAELLLVSDRSDIAMPVVEQLLQDVELHHLTDWQPELAQKSLRLAVRVARAAEQEPSARRTLWNRICKVAPADALELGPEILPG